MTRMHLPNLLQRLAGRAWPAGGVRTSRSRAAREAVVQRGVGDVALQAEIAAFLENRSGGARLSDRLHEIWRVYSWRSRARIAKSWLIGATIVNIGVIPLDIAIDDEVLWAALLWRAAIIPVFAFLSMQAFRRPRSSLVESAAIIVFIAAVMTLAADLGARLGGATFERYVLAAFFAMASAFVIVPLTFRGSLACAAVLCALEFLFQGINPAVPTSQMILTGIFYVAVVAALLSSRHAQEAVQQRAVLMRLRDAHRAAELAEANRQLEILATVDPLTGLFNRRCMGGRLGAAAAALRPGGRLSIAMLDVDHFKLLNDSFGHAEGDRCLQLVGRALAATCEAGGHVASRHGGEEFLVLLAGGSGRDAAERLRAAVEALAIAHPRAQRGIVTISVGLASVERTHRGAPIDLDALLVAADGALYDAKHRGRNRVHVATDTNPAFTPRLAAEAV